MGGEGRGVASQESTTVPFFTCILERDWVCPWVWPWVGLVISAAADEYLDVGG